MSGRLRVVSFGGGVQSTALTRFGRPINEAITEAQPTLFAPDGPATCDDGHCWT